MLEQWLNEELEQYILLNYRPDRAKEKAFAEEPKEKKDSAGGVLGINIDEINEALYTHDCKTLTNWRGNK